MKKVTTYLCMCFIIAFFCQCENDNPPVISYTIALVSPHDSDSINLTQVEKITFRWSTDNEVKDGFKLILGKDLNLTSSKTYIVSNTYQDVTVTELDSIFNEWGVGQNDSVNLFWTVKPVTGESNSEVKRLKVIRTVKNREIDYITFNGGDTATINWVAIGNRMEVEYETQDGNTATIEADGDVMATVCPNAKTQVALFKFRSVTTKTTGEKLYGDWFQWSLPHKSVYMIGSATREHEQGLDYAVEIPYDETHPGVYMLTDSLSCWFDWGDGGQYYDGSIRFLSSRSYSGDISFNCLPVVDFPSAGKNNWAPLSNTPMPVQSFYHKGVGKDWYMKKDERGKYKITLDLNVMTIKFEKLSQ